MKLAARLMLVLLMAVALCFVGYGYVTVQLRRQAMLREAQREVRDHGTALQVALEVFLRDHRLADMAELTEELSRADRILGVLIFDAHGAPVEASHPVLGYRARVSPLADDARRTLRSHGEVLQLDRGDVYAYAFPLVRPGEQLPRGSAVLLRDLAYIHTNLQNFAREVALGGAAVMLVLAVGIWLALRVTVLRPLSTLLRGVERVGGGDLGVKIVVPRRDEIGFLAQAFNKMTASLAGARDDLEAQSQANVALERRLQHAQRLALIGQLSASLAHQIGSPLNVILGRARYALKQGGQSERDVRHFQEIVNGADTISRVIERLLTQARKVRGRPGRVDLGQVAAETLRFLEAECERKGVQTSISAEPGIWVAGTRDELEQVVLNLCMNAIQAQPGGGRLDVAVRRVLPDATLARDSLPAAEAGEGPGEMAEVVVADAGPGIKPEARERIFEAFYTTKSAAEGTGLGLAICDEIVRRQGGTIVVSDGPERGAVFRVLLPLQAPAPASNGLGPGTEAPPTLPARPTGGTP